MSGDVINEDSRVALQPELGSISDPLPFYCLFGGILKKTDIISDLLYPGQALTRLHSSKAHLALQCWMKGWEELK